jgi:glycosyltransferase involved in cell wall biosynthesis
VETRCEVTLRFLRPGVDIALVSLGTTPGLRRSDEAFAGLVRRAGASCEVVPVRIGPSGKLRRNAAVTDLVEALAARRSARGIEARAVVYSTITAALLQPRGAGGAATPYGIRFDATAALNRPGPSGAWQRRVERGVLESARLLMPVSLGAEEAVAGVDRPRVRVPIPIEPVAGAAERDIDAVAYAGYPRKRGLEVLCAAWAEAAPPGARLVIGGADRAKGLAWLRRHRVTEPEGIEWAGELPREEWLERVGRARMYLNASRWEDFGIAPMEALAAGTPLVTVPTPGSFEALPLARALDTRLVARDSSADALAVAVRAGFAIGDEERAVYAGRASVLLEPYREDAVARVVAEQVLPGLGVAP